MQHLQRAETPRRCFIKVELASNFSRSEREKLSDITGRGSEVNEISVSSIIAISLLAIVIFISARDYYSCVFPLSSETRKTIARRVSVVEFVDENSSLSKIGVS